MRVMTCRQLGGPCDETFKAETFEEMGELSRKHVMEMMEKSDAPHLEAVAAMKSLMEKPGAMEEWFAERRKEFDALPEG